MIRMFAEEGRIEGPKMNVKLKHLLKFNSFFQLI